MSAQTNILNDLRARFGGAVSTDVIDMIFETHLAQHRTEARLRDFVPLLAGRTAAEELATLAPGLATVEFAARNHEVARAAAALANQRGVRATAAEAHPEDADAACIAAALAERGLSPAPLSRRGRTLQAPDVVVRLGSDAPSPAGKSVVVWEVAGEASTSEGAHTLLDALAARISETFGAWEKAAAPA